jgi:hypothetical protein
MKKYQDGGPNSQAKSNLHIMHIVFRHAEFPYPSHFPDVILATYGDLQNTALFMTVHTDRSTGPISKTTWYCVNSTWHYLKAVWKLWPQTWNVSSVKWFWPCACPVSVILKGKVIHWGNKAFMAYIYIRLLILEYIVCCIHMLKCVTFWAMVLQPSILHKPH